MSINRTVSPSRSTDTFYYHIKLVGLHSKNSYDLPINFKIFLYKGYQKIDTTRKTHVYQGNTCTFEDVLTFNMPLYNPTKRKVDFSLTLVEVAEEEIESTSCPILVGDMTEEFMKSGKNTFQSTGYFDNDDFSVEYLLYVDKNKANLLALIGSSQIRGATPKPSRTPTKEIEPPVKSVTSEITVETKAEFEEVVRKTPPARGREAAKDPQSQQKVKIQRKNDSETKSRSVKKEEVAVAPVVEKKPEPEKKVEPEPKARSVSKKQPQPEPVAEATPPPIVKSASKPTPAAQPKRQEQPPTILPQANTKFAETYKPTKKAPKEEQLPEITVEKVAPLKEFASKSPPKEGKKVSIVPPPAPKNERLDPPKQNILASGAPHLVNSVYITKQHLNEKKEEEKKIKEQVQKPAEGMNIKLIIAAVVMAAVILGLLFAGGGAKKPAKTGKKPRK